MILIRGAEIVDGTGKPPFKADVLVNGGRISAIGDFKDQQADEIIEAKGSYLVPGFIDVNTDSDHYLTLFTNPLQQDFLLQGVTTIVGGNCGSSLAPLLYGSLESIRKWADPNQINVDWHTMGEFLEVLGKRGLGVNFATLVGHSTVRRALIGEVFRDLTVKELGVFKKIILDSISEGAFGFSTGLGYAHSRQVPFQEIKFLVDGLGKGVVYSTHLRNERAGIVEAVREAIEVAKSGLAVIISHLRPLRGSEKEFSEAMEVLDTEGKGLNINFDSYPFDSSLVPIYTLLPDWLKNGPLETMLANIREGHLHERIIKELPEIGENTIVIASAPKAEFLVGKSIGEFSYNQGLGYKDGLLKLMEVTKMQATVFYHNINMDLSIQNLMSERSLVASNSPSVSDDQPTVRHERTRHTFPTFLDLVKGTRAMAFEKAIYKLTGKPARIFGLNERGEIKEGNIADLTVLKDGNVREVFVGGVGVVGDGVLTGLRPGKILKHEV